MVIARLIDAELAYGEQRLLDRVDLTLTKGERVVLVGRNGAGKSTLLKVLAGSMLLDDGERWVADPLTISYLDQDVPEGLDRTVYDVVASGLGDLGRHLTAYHDLAAQSDGAPRSLNDLHRLEANIEALGGWTIEPRISRAIEMLGLSPDVSLRDCSGGLRRRTMLARAIVNDPELLLLDEPTNHLDIDAIEHLQGWLLASRATLVVVTHDRALIDVLASRIVEVDRGRLINYPGSYRSYLEQRSRAADDEARAHRQFDRELAQEEAWIREGIKARRTRNEGRVRRLQALRLERSRRVDKQGNVKLRVDEGGRSGNLVADFDNVTFGYAAPLIKDFSMTVRRQDRLGIIGPNGCGKSTLIRLMLGELEPHRGRVARGSGLQVAYFDQQREILRDDLRVRESVAEGSDYVEIGGRRKHVAGYLADFLFPSSSLNMPVGRLSGGEKNRLMMARLFARPANLLVLDEPTNDLDVETLELLEELLLDFSGTIVVVSHDRRFLDSVVTSTVVFEGDGRLEEYVGGYSDWQRTKAAQESRQVAEPIPRQQVSKPVAERRRAQRLSYKDQRELDTLPDRIEALEAAQAELQAEVSDAAFYQQAEVLVREKLQALTDVTAQIEDAYARWEQLGDVPDLQ